MRSLIHTCGCLWRAHQHAHHRCGVHLAPETLVGEVRQVVTRKKTSHLGGQEDTNAGTSYGEVCPKCLGQQLWARVSCTWLGPQH